MLRFAYNEISLTVVVRFHQLTTEVGSTSTPYNCCTVSVVVATLLIFPSFCDAVLMASMSVLTGHEQASGKNLTSIEETFSTHMNHYASLPLLSPSHTYVYLPSTYPHTHIHPHSPDGQYVAAGSNDGLCSCGRRSLAKSRAERNTGKRQEHASCESDYIIVVHRSPDSA